MSPPGERAGQARLGQCIFLSCWPAPWERTEHIGAGSIRRQPPQDWETEPPPIRFPAPPRVRSARLPGGQRHVFEAERQLNGDGPHAVEDQAGGIALAGVRLE